MPHQSDRSLHPAGQCFPLVFRAPACCIKRVIVFTGSVSDRTGAAWISGPMTYSVLSCAGCVRRALNSSPFVWHLTQVKSVFPPTVCLECLPLECKRVYISVGAIRAAVVISCCCKKLALSFYGVILHLCHQGHHFSSVLMSFFPPIFTFC